MTTDYIRLIATVVFGLAVFSTPVRAHQEPLTVEELEKFVEETGGVLYQNDEREVGSVFLFGTQATNADLAHLSGLMALELLFLSGTQVTGGGVAELQKALPNCRISS